MARELRLDASDMICSINVGLPDAPELIGVVEDEGYYFATFVVEGAEHPEGRGIPRVSIGAAVNDMGWLYESHTGGRY